MLRIEDLYKTFTLEKGEVRAVQKGEFFALLGPSGSGKSTCLRCVAGLEQPDQGEIYIDWESISLLLKEAHLRASR